MNTNIFPGINKTYTIYAMDGRILRCVNCPPAMSKLQKRDNELILEGKSNPDLHRVVAKKIRDRPDNLAEVVGNTIINVPVPSTLFIGPDSYSITDSTVVLDLPLGGSYLVRLESFPYKDKVLQVVI